MSAATEAHARAPIAGPAALSRMRAPIVAGALVTMAAAAAAIAAGAAAGPSFLVPSSRAGFPDWLGGVLAGAGPGLSELAFSLLVLVMCACFGLALAWGDALGRRAVAGAIVLLHLIFLLAPPILTTDVFGYLDYGRLGAIHDLNPYAFGADSAPGDPIHPWVVWHELPSPYGPLFTIPTYGLAGIDFEVGLWLFKAAAALAGLGCVALVWRAAERLGRSPVAPAVLVGLNPLTLVWAVGGAHNDLFVALLVALGVERAIALRDRAAGAALAAAAAIKLTGGLALPFLLVARSRWRPAAAGALATLALVAVGGLAVLGGGLLDFPSALATQQELVSARSVPSYAGQILGLGGATDGIRVIAAVAFVAALAYLLLRTRRDADWVAAAGWATLALLLTSAWLMPWYVVWLLPLAALGRNSRLVVATLCLTGYVVATRLPILLG